jgi:NAD(P)-dependent dehydrogenase (short-subunit alcohol dehydrogenase family)
MESTTKVRYDGRAILVTGAGRGMGRAHALSLAARGAKVLVADRGVMMSGDGIDEGPANEVVAEIISRGGTASAYHGDLSTAEGARGAVEATLTAFGGIDGIIHNASTAPDVGPIHETPVETFDRTLRVNLYGAFHLAQTAWPTFLKQNYGRIVVIASHNIFGNSDTVPYSVAKAGYIGFVNSLALEGAEHNILVNGVAPTARTRMTERMPSSSYTDWLFETMAPENVTPAVAYLVSESATVNGNIYSVGGGRVSRIALAETHGVLGMGENIDAVAQNMDAVMADEGWMFHNSVSERGFTIAKLLGW